MNKKTAEKKVKYHLARWNYYTKKFEEAKQKENKIGFKFSRDQ